MDTEHLNINFDKDCQKGELVIREVNQIVEKELPVLEPDNVNIKGTISTIGNFLEKRWRVEGQIDHTHTHILVDRDNLKMTLVCNETDKRQKMTVTGVIDVSRQYTSFHINDDKAWDPMELGNFLRINRSYFESKEDNMELVKVLKDFKASIQSTLNKHKDNKGSYTLSYSAAVASNLPESFVVNIPIFKGSAAEKIAVEFDASVSGNDVSLHLVSPEAASIFEGVRDKYIDTEIDRIEKIAPEIPIIEQ